MSDSVFGLLLITIGLAYGFKEDLAVILNTLIKKQDKYEFTINTIHINYALLGILMLILIFGMLLTNTKEKYAHISKGFEEVKPKDLNRPNPLFDINTYW